VIEIKQSNIRVRNEDV